ncbi:MAG TPA: hypothetical protein VG099_23975, partial [Gemmataceae bacterium]|nr:hypothetical protein [Gemmataceae bacterium]
ALILKARMGDLAAIKLLFQYVIGKPTEAVNPDTIDIEEYKQIYQPQKEIMDDFQETAQTVPPRVLTPVVRIMNDVCVEEMRKRASAPPEQDANADKDEDDGQRPDDGMEERGPSPAPSPKRSNGAASMAGGRGNGQERDRGPSTNTAMRVSTLK